jgi:predicted dinucleotide-binding enzyme
VASTPTGSPFGVEVGVVNTPRQPPSEIEMKIAFLGYGSMAKALGLNWAEKHELMFAGRNPEKAAALAEALGHGGRAGSEADAAAFADAVVLATRSGGVFDTIEAAGGGEALAEKIVIDINNPVMANRLETGEFLPRSYDGGSLAEAIQRAAPGAKVVKAFNMCHTTVWEMDEPVIDGRRVAVLLAGDNAAAKDAVAGLVEDVGCEPVDLGELKYARLLEPAAAIVIKMLFSGRDKHTMLNLIQPERKPIA